MVSRGDFGPVELLVVVPGKSRFGIYDDDTDFEGTPCAAVLLEPDAPEAMPRHYLVEYAALVPVPKAPLWMQRLEKRHPDLVATLGIVMERGA